MAFIIQLVWCNCTFHWLTVDCLYLQMTGEVLRLVVPFIIKWYRSFIAHSKVIGKNLVTLQIHLFWNNLRNSSLSIKKKKLQKCLWYRIKCTRTCAGLHKPVTPGKTAKENLVDCTPTWRPVHIADDTAEETSFRWTIQETSRLWRKSWIFFLQVELKKYLHYFANISIIHQNFLYKLSKVKFA